jgi:DNA-binding GntR family transcriptional regulator
MASVELVRGLREQIASQLRDEILFGHLEEGEALVEAKLAARFDVSRGPIREALIQLANEGVAVSKANCGTRVAFSAPDFICDFLVPIRRQIESFALRYYFINLCDGDYENWHSILEKMKTACRQCDYGAMAEQDIGFHRSIVERADLPDLLTIWSALVVRIRKHFRDSHQAYDDPMRVYVEHAAIVAAFQTGDVDVAVRALEGNIA